MAETEAMMLPWEAMAEAVAEAMMLWEAEEGVIRPETKGEEEAEPRRRRVLVAFAVAFAGIA